MSEGLGHMGLVFTKGITPLALERWITRFLKNERSFCLLPSH